MRKLTLAELAALDEIYERRTPKAPAHVIRALLELALIERHVDAYRVTGLGRLALRPNAGKQERSS